MFTDERKSFEEPFDRGSVSRANSRVKSVVNDILELRLSFMQQLERHVQCTACMHDNLAKLAPEYLHSGFYWG